MSTNTLASSSHGASPIQLQLGISSEHVALLRSAFDVAKPFVTGATAGMIVTSISQPIDTLKTRIQIVAAEGGAASAGVLPIMRGIIAQDGVSGVYKGLTAAVTRQLLYKGASLGFFDVFKKLARGQDTHLSFFKTSVCAMSAGGLGALLSNPADKALVRMQADSLLPPAQRKAYRHVGHAIVSMVQHEGVTGLFRGSIANLYRGISGNFGMLAVSAYSKQQMEQNEVGSERSRVFASAAMGGLAMSCCSLPFDYVKTQLQKMTPDPCTGNMPYNGPMDCAVKQLRAQGPKVFYTGFPIFFARIAPTAMAVLVVQDYLKLAWKHLGL